MYMKIVFIEVGACSKSTLQQKNYDLHPNMCNKKSHLYFVFLAGSTPPEFVGNEN